MMSQAFYTGLSGVRSNQYAINVTADNLSNISTVGFRGSDIEFSSLFENMLHTSENTTSVDSSVGVGSRLQAVTTSQETGSLLLSDRSTDLAIQGDGWFAIQREGNPLYTRAGNFTFDANDDLVTTDGYHVLGTMGGNIGSNNILTSSIDEVTLGSVATQEKLRFPKTLTYPAEPTKNAKFFANLGVENEFRAVSAGVIDAAGDKNALRLEFTKNPVQTLPNSQWTVLATVTSTDGSKVYDTKSGEIEFDSSGALISNTLTSINNNGSEVAIDLGSGFGGIVSIDKPVSSGSSTADGTVSGDLVGYAINKNAEVIATFTNGMQSSIGKIAVYHFQNDEGLERISGARFGESTNSGKPIFFTDADGKNIIGTDISNFMLENSNVRIEAGLTELIILQRSYDANSKSISTADQMIQKALNMHK